MLIPSRQAHQRRRKGPARHGPGQPPRRQDTGANWPGATLPRPLTADDGGREGAAQDGRDGSAASRKDGGALQEHGCDSDWAKEGVSVAETAVAVESGLLRGVGED